MIRYAYLAALAGWFLLAGAAGSGVRRAVAAELPALDAKAAQQVSFRRDVWPIVKRHCWGCHSGGDAQGGLSMDSVADMLRGGDSGSLFEPGKPDDSLLIAMTIGDSPDMPKQQPPLSEEKIQILRHWILAGAKDDSRAEAAGSVVQIPEKYRFAPAVTSVAFSPDGQQLAAACRSEVVLIELASDQPPRRLPTACDLLTHVEFSPDGKLLAAAGGTPAVFGEVQFFDVASGKTVARRRSGHDTLFRGNFAPDGKAIALGGADGAVHVVPVDETAAIRLIDLHSDWVLDVAYTPDGQRLVSGGRDKSVKVSSVETGQLLRTVDTSNEMFNCVIADDKFAVATGKARAVLSYQFDIALSGVEVTGAGNGARPISKRAQYAQNFESQPGEVLDMASSGDRQRLALAGNYGDVRVYSLADRKAVATISKVPSPVYAVALNHDGTLLAIGARSGLVQVYSVPDGKLLHDRQPVPVETK